MRPQLTIDGRELVATDTPSGQHVASPLFNAPQTIRGQLAMSTDTDTLIEELRAADEACRAAPIARDEVIARASKTMSVRQIAEHVSVTRGRVQQIAAKARQS